MPTLLNEVLMANREYAASFDKGELPMPPRTAFCHFDLHGCPS